MSVNILSKYIKNHRFTPEFMSLIAKWDEEAHPRHPEGTREGGRFAPKEEGTTQRSGKPGIKKSKSTLESHIDDILHSHIKEMGFEKLQGKDEKRLDAYNGWIDNDSTSKDAEYLIGYGSVFERSKNNIAGESLSIGIKKESGNFEGRYQIQDYIDSDRDYSIEIKGNIKDFDSKMKKVKEFRQKAIKETKQDLEGIIDSIKGEPGAKRDIQRLERRLRLLNRKTKIFKTDKSLRLFIAKWDETKHPRWPKGHPSGKGGKFMSKEHIAQVGGPEKALARAQKETKESEKAKTTQGTRQTLKSLQGSKSLESKLNEIVETKGVGKLREFAQKIQAKDEQGKKVRKNARKDKLIAALVHHLGRGKLTGTPKEEPKINSESSRKLLRNLFSVEDVKDVASTLKEKFPTVKELREFAKLAHVKIAMKGTTGKTAHERAAEFIHDRGAVVRLDLDRGRKTSKQTQEEQEKRILEESRKPRKPKNGIREKAQQQAKQRMLEKLAASRAKLAEISQESKEKEPESEVGQKARRLSEGLKETKKETRRRLKEIAQGKITPGKEEKDKQKLMEKLKRLKESGPDKEFDDVLSTITADEPPEELVFDAPEKRKENKSTWNKGIREGTVSYGASKHKTYGDMLSSAREKLKEVKPPKGMVDEKTGKVITNLRDLDRRNKELQSKVAAKSKPTAPGEGGGKKKSMRDKMKPLKETTESMQSRMKPLEKRKISSIKPRITKDQIHKIYGKATPGKGEKSATLEGRKQILDESFQGETVVQDLKAFAKEVGIKATQKTKQGLVNQIAKELETHGAAKMFGGSPTTSKVKEASKTHTRKGLIGLDALKETDPSILGDIHAERALKFPGEIQSGVDRASQMASILEYRGDGDFDKLSPEDKRSFIGTALELYSYGPIKMNPDDRIPQFVKNHKFYKTYRAVWEKLKRDGYLDEFNHIDSDFMLKRKGLPPLDEFTLKAPKKSTKAAQKATTKLIKEMRSSSKANPIDNWADERKNFKSNAPGSENDVALIDRIVQFKDLSENPNMPGVEQRLNETLAQINDWRKAPSFAKEHPIWKKIESRKKKLIEDGLMDKETGQLLDEREIRRRKKKINKREKLINTLKALKGLKKIEDIRKMSGRYVVGLFERAAEERKRKKKSKLRKQETYYAKLRGAMSGINQMLATVQGATVEPDKTSLINDKMKRQVDELKSVLKIA